MINTRMRLILLLSGLGIFLSSDVNQTMAHGRTLLTRQARMLQNDCDAIHRITNDSLASEPAPRHRLHCIPDLNGRIQVFGAE
jgi:hypothetical protein